MIEIRIAYISGCYRNCTIDGVFDNIMKAREVVKKYIPKGYLAICPHTATAFLEGSYPEDVWIKGWLSFIERLIPGTDIVVMMKDWTKSEGARAEFEKAIKRDIEVIFEKEK